MTRNAISFTIGVAVLTLGGMVVLLTALGAVVVAGRLA